MGLNCWIKQYLDRGLKYSTWLVVCKHSVYENFGWGTQKMLTLKKLDVMEAYLEDTTPSKGCVSAP